MKIHRKHFVALTALAAGLVAGAGPLDGINPAWSTKGGVTDAIEVPNSVVGDFSSFTARITLNVTSQPAAGSSVVLLDQWTSDTGWKLAVTFDLARWNTIVLKVNENEFSCGAFRVTPGKAIEFVVTARGGLVVVYQNGKPLQRACHFITPNLEPVKVWRKASNAPMMDGVSLAEAAFFGKDVEYYADGESREFATGVKGGKGWNVSVPIDTSRNLPKVLCYGDSIMADYFRELPTMLKEQVYCYSYHGFITRLGNVPEAGFLGACSVADYDLVLFNNGLHSLDWTEDKATDEQIKESYRSLVRVFRKGAPKAKLVYMMTTPHNSGGAKPRKVGKHDPAIRRLNRLAGEVMAEEKVDVFDAYAFMLPNLDSSRDALHWDWGGNRKLARRVADEILFRLGRGPDPSVQKEK